MNDVIGTVGVVNKTKMCSWEGTRQIATTVMRNEQEGQTCSMYILFPASCRLEHLQFSSAYVWNESI